MIHLRDITKIEQAPFVDCITFGSPCQDLSMAGKREGLKGERSGLFMQAVRIIKEMRIRSGGLYPTFAVWENVPGAFSSNGGEDFRTVLEELARIAEADACIPRPEKGKWPKAGYIAGDHFSIAWRTFDAQYWGVPQRRNRIALVVDFGGQRAGEILFERTSLRGDTEPSIPPWEGIARNPADGSAGHDRMIVCRAHGQANAETLEDCCPTLSCNHEQPIVFESHSQDARYTQQGDTTHACTAQWGTGGNNMPLVAFSKETYNTGKNARCSLGIGSGDIAPTMRADTHPSGVAYKRLRWIVRRLTPTECERLQGFPDGWTDIGEWTDTKGKRHKTADSPRYKALGNSIALPQWWWITCKMARYLPEKATLGSLFDGIGGFPLVWESRHGKGTAVWASEIEEFPIAVTKMRFKEE